MDKRKLLIPLSFMMRIWPTVHFTRAPFKIFEFEEMLKNVDITNNDVILDVGCGVGLQTLCLGKQCQKIIGIDPDENTINAAEKLAKYTSIKCEFIAKTIESAAFNDSYFDKVFSICVIEHIKNYHKVMQEIYRVLKPGGFFIFSVDCLQGIPEKLRDIHSKDHHVEHYFEPSELNSVLKDIGYQNINIYSIFRSQYAKDLFRQCIINNCFSFNDYLWKYWQLKRAEALSKEEEGVFLIATARRL